MIATSTIINVITVTVITYCNHHHSIPDCIPVCYCPPLLLLLSITDPGCVGLLLTDCRVGLVTLGIGAGRSTCVVSSAARSWTENLCLFVED